MMYLSVFFSHVLLLIIPACAFRLHSSIQLKRVLVVRDFERGIPIFFWQEAIVDHARATSKATTLRVALLNATPTK